MTAFVGNTRYRTMVNGNRVNFVTTKLLPYDAEIEYLGFAQNCAVDTGIKPSTNYKYYWKYYWTNIERWTYPFTNNGSSGSWFLFGGIEQSNRTQIHIKSSATITGSVLNVDTLYEGSLEHSGDNMVEKLNNTSMVTLAYEDYQSVTNLNIANLRDYAVQIYYFKVCDENDVLILDLIPVRVGQIGYMYDKVSGTLFGNNGTGSFTLGPDKN